MKVKDMKSIIQDLDDEVDIEVNSVLDEEKQELTPSSCEAFYHEKDNKVYITPEVIAM